MTYFCRICKTPLEPFMTFGHMPIPNAFLRSEADFGDEFFYEMKPAVCPSCQCFQLVKIPKPEQMFHANYAYFASTSQVMSRHFAAMAQDLTARYLNGADAFVTEMGSNDGITLRNFAKAGIRHLGIEPSASVAEAARMNGVKTLCAFFSAETAKTVAAQHGQADILIATNTMHNIEDTNGVAEGAAILLKPKGVMIQEDPYLGDVIEGCSYDQIYAEHMYLWSITSVNNVFGRHGMEIFHVEHNDHHGGCMRYHIGKMGMRPKSPALLKAMSKESDLGLGKAETYVRFKERCEESRDRLMGLIEGCKRQGKRVAGYGATAKSATVINWCGITPDHLDWIQDSTPAKQGSFSPGAHILIVAPERFRAAPPDAAVLFAWNHLKEIDDKERAWRRAGGKWILPVRNVEMF